MSRSREAGFPNYAVYRELILAMPPAWRADVKTAVQLALVNQQTNDYLVALREVFHEYRMRWGSIAAGGNQ